MKAVIRVAAALLYAAVVTGALPCQAADDSNLLQALAGRIAGEGVQTLVELDVGRIGNLPVAIALPADVKVLGTVVRRPTGEAAYGVYRYTQYQIYFDAPEQPAALRDAIAGSVASAGYQPTPQPNRPSGGFAVEVPGFALFCKAGDPRSITTQLSRVENVTRGVVTISEPLATNPQSGGTPCNRPAPSTTFGDTAPLPAIAAVDGVRIERRSSTAGYGYSEQTVDVFTSLAPRALLERWAGDIAPQGWTQVAAATGNDSGAVVTFRGQNGGRDRVLALTIIRLTRSRLAASMRNFDALEPSRAAAGRGPS